MGEFIKNQRQKKGKKESIHSLSISCIYSVFALADLSLIDEHLNFTFFLSPKRIQLFNIQIPKFFIIFFLLKANQDVEHFFSKKKKKMLNI